MNGRRRYDTRPESLRPPPPHVIYVELEDRVSLNLPRSRFRSVDPAEQDATEVGR
jgi:hypothetical protein